MDKRSSTIFFTGLLFVVFLLSGCSSKPYLTPNNEYQVIKTLPNGSIDTIPIHLPWNSNSGLLNKLLLEASFVLSDLHTLDPEKIKPSSIQTIVLRVDFQEAKRMNLRVNDKELSMDVVSIQIEVDGNNIGRVIINQTSMLQGIVNPNLKPAYLELMKTYEQSAEENFAGQRIRRSPLLPLDNMEFDAN
ncbi:MAG: hypothetical protein M0T74_08245 [Desulfitobacterium hafniense]|nr:hypothetical protein [Desulfitobacterium hafniense]